MAGLQLSGLATGFDWKSVVDQLIALERVPQNRLRAEKSTNTAKLNTFSTLRSRMTALQDAIKQLSSDTRFGQRAATFADEDLTWRATAANESVVGEFTFAVAQLATKSVRAGAGNRAAALHSSSDVSELLVSDLRLAVPVTTGVFTINGAQVTVEETDMLGDVFAKIATATGGDVTAAYDPATDQVTLTSASSSTITLGAGADTSNFLYALKLYNNNSATVSSATALGTLERNSSIADSGLATGVTGVDADGNGSFVINGVTIDYNVNDGTLQDIINRVNASDAGVVLAYDPMADSFRLTNRNTGDLDLVAADTTGNLLAALGLTTGATVTRGTNAQFSVNGGGTIVSASNVLDESVHGLQGLSVTVDSVASHTVTVTADTDAIKTGIRTFIEKYNDVQKLIDEQTKVTVGADGTVTAAPFANNRELTDIARQLRSMVFEQVPGLSGTISRLESIGIDFNSSSSELAIRDEARLDEALANNLQDVTALFTTATTGLSAKLGSYIDRLTVTNGLLDAQETSLEKQNASLDDQIAALERRLEAERTRLEESFIRMEEAQQKINTQLAALQRTLNLS